MTTQNDIDNMEKFSKMVGDSIKNMPEGYKLKISGYPFRDDFYGGVDINIQVIPNEQEF